MDINNWGFNNAVVVIGLVVVFVILILLVILCAVMGKVFQMINNGAKDKGQNNSNVSVRSGTPQGNTVTINMIQDDIGDDVVAAITAAIAVILSSEGNTKPFTVRSIKRARELRPAWNAAGINENTRPF